MNDKTGGPAFPSPLDTAIMAGLNPRNGALGMTLRDYFAAKASEEDIAQYMPCRSGLQGPAITERLAKSRQQARYMHADDMLSERAK
jgi:hypothetical protein